MEGRPCTEIALETKTAVEGSSTVVEIKIKTLDSQVYTCRVEKNVSVPDLKEQVALITGVPIGSQRLICRGKVLKDDHVLSAYEVEDGHTLHLVTRPAHLPSALATPSGNQSEEQDPNNLVSRNRPGHISHSVLVGTFNVPDHGGVVFPEFNRIFSSVLSSLRVGSIFPPLAVGSTLSISGDTLQGREENTDDGREQGANQQALHRETGPSIDDVSTVHRDAGLVGGVPAVSHVRILHQIVPGALRTASQYVRRMEQILAGQLQASFSNLDTQPTATEAPTGHGDYLYGGIGDPAAWAFTFRRIQELLSNEAGTELRRLADLLEVETSLGNLSARSSIISAGTLMEQLGHLLLELGRMMLTLQGDWSRPGGGLDTRMDMASEQAAEPMHYEDNGGLPANMHTRIPAGPPPLPVATNFLSQPCQYGPPLSLNVDGSTIAADFQNDRDASGTTNTLREPFSMASTQPPGNLNELGTVGGFQMRNMESGVNEDHSFLDDSSMGRGMFYPLIARFHDLGPSLFSRQELPLDLCSNEESSLARRDGLCSREHDEPEPGKCVSSRHESNRAATMEDPARPFLYNLEAPQSMAREREQPEIDHAPISNQLAGVEAETSLQLKCSERMPNDLKDEITADGGTVLQDLLSSLACRRDEHGDVEPVMEHDPQALFLNLKNNDNHEFSLGSSGSNVVDVASSCSKLPANLRDADFDALGPSARPQCIKGGGGEKTILGKGRLRSLLQATSRDGGADLQQLFPLASSRDSEGLHCRELQNCEIRDGLFSTTMDYDSLLQTQSCVSAALASDKNDEGSKRLVPDMKREGLQAAKRQKME